MNVRGKNSYLYLLVLLVATGCTKLSPQLSFGLLKSSDDSLTIEANIATINSTSANSTVQLKGLCESNTNLNLIGPNNLEFKCENLSYTKEVSASLFNEGENVITIEALDNSQNKIAGKQLRIIKDTIVPTVTITGPANIPGTDTTVPLSGQCSENNLPVDIQDLTQNNRGSTTCTNGTWSYSAPIGSNFSSSTLKFKAQQTDSAGNFAATNSIDVIRNVTAAFTINGVKNFPAETANNLLRRTTGSMIVEWTASINANSYDVYIERNFQSSPTTVCSHTGISTTNYTFGLNGAPCALTVGENLRVKVLGWDSAHTNSTTEYFLFTVKPAPEIRADAKILYINSDPDTAVGTIAVPYTDLVSDPNSAGPFTVTVTDSGGLASMITPDNSSSTRVLNIAPTTSVSGIFPVKIKIADENSVSSDELILKIAVVYPHSWSGNLSNDFSAKGNWCGVAGLKTGCTGVTTLPSSTTRVFIDNLCELPTPGAESVHCAPRLTTDWTVRSFFMKYGSFAQADHAFTVGALADSGSYFKMSSGAFNDGSVSGTLTIYKAFQIENGVFNAPKNSDVNFNTNTASNGSDAFKIANTYNYFHNNSTLNLLDPTGQALTQYINVPSGMTLGSLTINSNGGYWAIKSTGLFVAGDLNLNGTKDSSNNYPMLNSGTAGAKLVLSGNLNCGGAFGGGNLAVYISGSSSKYKTTVAGCKMPQIKVSDPSASVAESSYSTEDTVMQSLSVTTGNFTAPVSTRRLIFRSSGLDDGTVVADLNNGGFIHNNGTVVFETASSSLNFKISLPTMYDVVFTNPSNLSSFYDVQNNFNSNSLYLKGTYRIPMRGSSRTIVSNQVTFDTGFVVDSNQLTRVSQQSTNSSYVYVNTTDPIYVPQLEMKNAYGFSGSSTFLNFSGTTLVLSYNDIYIGLFQELRYYAKTGSGNISGLGIYGSGY